MKRYSIHIDGFGEPYRCEAETASKARYKAWRSYCEAGFDRTYPGRETFRSFLGRITQTLHLGPA